MKAVFVRAQYRKSLLASSIFLLGIIAHHSNAAPLTDLPQYIQDKLPSNATEYHYVPSYDISGSSGNIGVVQAGTVITGHNIVSAVYVNGNAGFTPAIVVLDGVTVDISTDVRDGLRTNGGTVANPGYIIAGNDLTIKVKGEDGDGINAGYFTGTLSMPTTGSSIIDVGDRLTIVTEGYEGRGISAYQTLYWNGISSNNKNTVTVGDYAHITTKGDRSEGIRVGGTSTGTVINTVNMGNNTYVETQGSSSLGLYANNGTMTLGNNTTVVTAQDASHGIQSTGTIGVISLGSNAAITTNGTNNTHSIYTTSGGKVTLVGGATISNAGTQATNSYAIYATGTNSKVDGSAAGIYRIKGDIFATSNGAIDLNMTSTSLWTGAAYLGSTGASNIAMANNSVWNMTGNSQITSLNSSGTVNFQSSAGNYYTLTTGSLSGNSTFGMKVDMVGQQGDLIDVTNTNVSGNHKLVIANNGAANTDGTEVLTVVKTLDNTQGNFTSNTVEVGAYEYSLRQKTDGKEWELFATPRGPGPYTTTAEASVNLLNANYLLSYIDNQTLLQRMGQLRASNNQQGDFWIRGFGGKLNSFGGGSVSGFDMSYKGTQMGIDKLINTNNGRLYVGTMVGITDADPDYRGGHGTTKDYHFGLYSTYMADNGFYVDGVLKYTHMKNRFNVKDTVGDTVTGKGTSEGYSASVEAGKRFYLSGSNKASGYYIEPQAQITYGYQGGMNINGSNGLKTKLSNYNFALGRASAIVGYSIDSATPIDIYIKTGYVREFDGKTSYQFNQGEKINHSFKGGWWDNGIGVNAQINKKHNIYADINYAKGSRFDQKQLNLGYRYSF